MASNQNRWLPLFLFAACFVALSWLLRVFTVDDAYIVARYARRIVRGAGYNFSEGAPTDGVTGPIWLLPGLIGEFIGVGAVVLQKLTGVACALLAVGFSYVSAKEHTQGGAQVLLAVFCLCQANLVIWSVAGLETGLATLLATVVFVSAMGPTKRVRTALCAAALLVTLRPESLIFALASAALIRRRDGTRAAVLAAMVPLSAFVALCAIRWWCFGHPLPLSYFAKSTSIDIGYVMRGMFVSTGLVPLFAAAWQAASWPSSSGNRHGDACTQRALTLIGVYGLSVAWAGGDWMPGFRLLVPVLPALGWLVARAFVGAKLPIRVLIVAALLVPAVDAYVQVPRAFAAGARREAKGRELVRQIKRYAEGGTVAMIDIGFVGFTSNLPVLDLGGVTDPRVAHAAGGHLSKQVELGLFEAQAPALIVVHSSHVPEGPLTAWPAISGYPIENWIYTQPWTRANYKPVSALNYAPSYSYLLLVRKTNRPQL